MIAKTGNPEKIEDLRVLIIGAGIVGLTIAQGCREKGIPFTIFERDQQGSRTQGWSLTLHWCMRSLERTIGPKLSSKLSTAMVDPNSRDYEGKALFFNAATGKVGFEANDLKPRVRVQREKLRDLLATGIDIQEGKSLEAIEELQEGGIKAHFKDGTSATGTMIIGADGNNSVVRKFLLGSQWAALNALPFNLIGVIRSLTAEQAATLSARDPLFFRALDPVTGNFVFFSLQDSTKDVTGKYSCDALVSISYLVKDKAKDAIPPTNQARIQAMKARAAGFAEPFRSLVMDIDESSEAGALSLADFPTIPWDNKNGRVTLAGDAAHVMTMFRGEGANHGILDAALLLDQLRKIQAGSVTQQEALDEYETEMVPRGHAAALLSRQAVFDAHNWESLTLESPCLNGARVPPATA